jgi:hypothetical protein
MEVDGDPQSPDGAVVKEEVISPLCAVSHSLPLVLVLLLVLETLGKIENKNEDDLIPASRETCTQQPPSWIAEKTLPRKNAPFR